MNTAAAIFLSSIFLFSRSMVVPMTAASLQVHATGVSSSTSIPQGAQHVRALTIEFRASCAAKVSVSTLTIHHVGLGSSQDILRVYAVDSTSSVRLTNAGALSGNPAETTLRFLSPLTIPACSTKTIVIDADISPTAAAGGEHLLTTSDANDIESTAQTVTVSADTLAALSTVPATPVLLNVTFLPVRDNDILFGSNRTVARFQLQSASDRSQAVESITLTNDGTASNTDLENLFLTTDGGNVVTDVLHSLSEHTATFVFDPSLSIAAHALQLLQVHADVRASKRYTIKLTLDEPSDLSAIYTNR